MTVMKISVFLCHLTYNHNRQIDTKFFFVLTLKHLKYFPSVMYIYKLFFSTDINHIPTGGGGGGGGGR